MPAFEELRFLIRPLALAVGITAPVVALVYPPAIEAQSRPAKAASVCERLTFEGAAEAGKSYSQPIGGGLEFRLVPFPDKSPEGWEIRIDPATANTYPDYAQVATPPFQSVNPLWLTTAYGFRAQDVVGWNPRQFQFVRSEAEYTPAASAFFSYLEPHGNRAAMPQDKALQMLLNLPAISAHGEFKILDAHLSPGTADPKPGVGEWARRLSSFPHTFDAALTGPGAGAGELHSIRFRITLWLPPGWKSPSGVRHEQAACVN